MSCCQNKNAPVENFHKNPLNYDQESQTYTIEEGTYYAPPWPAQRTVFDSTLQNSFNTSGIPDFLNYSSTLPQPMPEPIPTMAAASFQIARGLSPTQTPNPNPNPTMCYAQPGSYCYNNIDPPVQCPSGMTSNGGPFGNNVCVPFITKPTNSMCLAPPNKYCSSDNSTPSNCPDSYKCLGGPMLFKPICNAPMNKYCPNSTNTNLYPKPVQCPKNKICLGGPTKPMFTRESRKSVHAGRYDLYSY